MDCRIVQNSLSNYLDGDLHENEITLIENHLTECLLCKSVKLDLTEIQVAARELPLHTPSTVLWQRIQQSLAAEAMSGEAEARAAGSRKSGLAEWWADLKARHFTFSFPQLAGAGALAMLLIGVSLFGAYRQGRFTDGSDNRMPSVSAALIPEEPALIERVKFLSDSLDKRRASWDPVIEKLYDGKLTRIRQKLAECKQQLSEKPGNKDQEQMVRDLYREEIELLELFDKMK